jgi:hypothetical protein
MADTVDDTVCDGANIFSFKYEAKLLQNLADDLIRRLSTVQVGFAPENISTPISFPPVWFEPWPCYRLSSVENRLCALACAWCNCPHSGPYNGWHSETSCQKLVGIEDSLFARMLE